jgi:hypothetical protein
MLLAVWLVADLGFWVIRFIYVVFEFFGGTSCCVHNYLVYSAQAGCLHLLSLSIKLFVICIVRPAFAVQALEL